MDDFFKPVQILPGKSSQTRKPRPAVVLEPEAPKLRGVAYADEYVRHEEQIYQQSQSLQSSGAGGVGRGRIFSEKKVKNRSNASHCELSDIDSVTTSASGIGSDADDKLDVYNKYKFNQKPSQKLSIEKQKSEILKEINSRRIVIITGATGCGKSTQVPQYILDAASAKRMYCNIVVTQPRRIAATSVCKRVADERKETVGNLIGYQIGQEKVGGEDTRILFCTTGVLLQKLIANHNESEFTHYILDEVHERDQEMDFLLIVIRKLINTRFSNAKLIVMSATVNVNQFIDYLYTVYLDKKIPPYHVKLEERHNFDIKAYFLDDILDRIIEARSLPVLPERPEVLPNAFVVAVRLIKQFDFIDNRECGKRGAVLVFLPGIFEIEEMDKNLKLMKDDKKNENWEIMVLHSTVTHEEQQRVFKILDKDKRKIILATNIAESSITVPDVKYVIDFCLTKTLVTDQDTNFSTLLLDWASKSSLEQRAGRVGRVAFGRVYRLIHERFYTEHLDQDSQPEILRCPLDRLVLQVKLLRMGSPKAILALAMNTPDLGNIQQAVSTLKEIGALNITTTSERTPDEKYHDSCDGDITFMGRVITALPMDVRLGKLVFLGNLFNVLEDAIIMACAMATKNMFSTPFQDHLKSYNSKLSWADSSCSDCIAFLQCYKLWRHMRTSGKFSGGPQNSEKKWARDEYVQLNVLSEVAVLEKEVTMRLGRFPTFRRHENLGRGVFEDTVEKSLFLKLAVAGAFYPNYFFRSVSTINREKEAVNELGGHDPYTTVYLKGMPENQPSILYKNSIRSHFEQLSHRVNVVFDSGSKVYIKFRRATSQKAPEEGSRSCDIPGKIEMAVYRAVKMRQTLPKGAIRIRVLNPIDAKMKYDNYVKECGILDTGEKNPEIKKMMESIAWPWNRNAPACSDIFTVHISHVESPSQFWIQNTLQKSVDMLKRITGIINAKDNVSRFQRNDELTVGKIYTMKYEDEGDCAMYRCRIISREKVIEGYYKYVVQFIDYGNIQNNVLASELFEVKPEIRAQYLELSMPDFAVECSLAKVKPPKDDIWNKKAISMMKSYTYRTCLIKVYSFVDDVLAVKMMPPKVNDKTDPKFTKETINYIMVQNQLAQKSDENFLSMVNHDERKKILEIRKERKDTSININPGQALLLNREYEDIEPPPIKDCRQDVYLRGPFSPLEMKVTSISKSSMSKNVIIEKDSVNSVLLDNDPCSSHERMLVAAFVGTNPTRDKLTLRHTTIMPSLPGLPAITCMLFAPMVELRCDPDFSNFTGALCGLGYDVSGRSLFPENDMELLFDVEFHLDHIELINKVRHAINLAVEEQSATVSSEGIIENIRNLFHKILNLNSLPTYHNPNSFGWGLIPEEKLMPPLTNWSIEDGIRPYNDFSVTFRLIWGVETNLSFIIDREEVERNIKELETLANGKLIRRGGVECMLCRVSLESCINAKLHMKSTYHKIRLSNYKVSLVGDEIENEIENKSVSGESDFSGALSHVENF